MLSKRNRAVGALLGLATGDALGTTLEFTLRDAQPAITDMVGGGPFHLEPGQWTDDTSMALCLADSLLEFGVLDTHDVMVRFAAWWRKGENSCTGRCFDIGVTTRKALKRFKRTGEPLSGSTDPMTAGNGSLMRLAPIAIRWHADRELAKEAAREQSKTTHAAPAAVDACEFFAGLLIDAINGAPRAKVLTPLDFAGDPAIRQIASGGWKEKRRDEVSSSGYVADTLEAALWCVDRAEGFDEAVLAAANLCDDADTVAAVAGQLAGAIWGVNSIPKHWLERLAWRSHIEDLATKLFDLEPETSW